MEEFVRAVRDDFSTGSRWSPPVDLEESDDAFIVEADLPGVARDDLTIDWSGRDLTIHGEVKERDRRGVLRRQTRRTGSFGYTVTLPADIDGDNATADLRDGVLTITAPKTHATKTRRIELSN
ncbi:Hsp20/alpha crystallin family protein [Kribbella albertanoniae]|uniref:Hsp20/alpha crystallin family protein n=2 Tax=Kribbella albertanoniae TaxID=1266829 RepID=A0A4R4PBJ6_9ACTN|nr:Hsp20/alpha crystallin family protein [Kribbella albertanoniae]